jgi:hypothetical protein
MCIFDNNAQRNYTEHISDIEHLLFFQRRELPHVNLE